MSHTLEKLSGLSVGPQENKYFKKKTLLRVSNLTFIDGYRRCGKSSIMTYLRGECTRHGLKFVNSCYDFKNQRIFLYPQGTRVLFFNHPEVDEERKPDSADILQMGVDMGSAAERGIVIICETKSERLISAAQAYAYVNTNRLSVRQIAIIYLLTYAQAEGATSAEKDGEETRIFNLGLTAFGELGTLKDAKYLKETDLYQLPQEFKAVELNHAERLQRMRLAAEQDQKKHFDQDMMRKAKKARAEAKEKRNAIPRIVH